MQPTDWRRLMDRPRLAPEHVAWLRQIAECSEYGRRSYEELIADADPAADMAYSAAAEGARTYEIKLEPTGGPFQSSLYGKASEVVPAWVDRLLAGQP